MIIIKVVGHVSSDFMYFYDGLPRTQSVENVTKVDGSYLKTLSHSYSRTFQVKSVHLVGRVISVTNCRTHV